METGKLVFTFTLDPHAYKQEMSKINKLIAAAEASGKPIKDPKALKPKPKENISAKTMSRAQAQPSQFERLASNMVKNYREENYRTNEVVMKDLLTKHSLWANQAYELLYTFKE